MTHKSKYKLRNMCDMAKYSIKREGRAGKWILHTYNVFKKILNVFYPNIDDKGEL